MNSLVTAPWDLSPDTLLGATLVLILAALLGEGLWRLLHWPRLMGYGEVQGSVAGGGLIREVETVVAPAGASTFTVNPQTESGPVVLTPSTTLSK